jgi:hypothetical protein
MDIEVVVDKMMRKSIKKEPATTLLPPKKSQR